MSPVIPSNARDLHPAIPSAAAVIPSAARDLHPVIPSAAPVIPSAAPVIPSAQAVIPSAARDLHFDPRLLIASATSFIGLGEQGGPNRGQVVELFLRQVRQPPGQPWCAAFVHHVGFWSHYDHATHKSRWPLPATASCWELGEFARARGVLRKDAQPGDVFLVFSPKLNRFAHTGIVVSLDGVSQQPAGDTLYTCSTIEGNTNEAGSREGTHTLHKSRTFSIKNGDRFIRWTELTLTARAA